MAGDHPPLSNENTFGLSFHGQCPVVSGAGGGVGADQRNYSCQQRRPEGLFMPVTHVPSEPVQVLWIGRQSRSFMPQASGHACCAPGSGLRVGNTRGRHEDGWPLQLCMGQVTALHEYLQIPDSVHPWALLVIGSPLTHTLCSLNARAHRPLTRPAQFCHRAFAHHFCL